MIRYNAWPPEAGKIELTNAVLDGSYRTKGRSNTPDRDADGLVYVSYGRAIMSSICLAQPNEEEQGRILEDLSAQMLTLAAQREKIVGHDQFPAVEYAQRFEAGMMTGQTIARTIAFEATGVGS